MKLSSFLHDLTLAIQEFDLDFDCFSKGQLESKEWLIEIMKNLQLDFGTIFILCGWYGILPAMMWLNSVKFDKIRSFDIDDKCIHIANRINRTNLQDNWKFQAVTKDIFNMNFISDKYKLWSYGKKKWFEVTEKSDTVINTSCEHTNPKWFDNIPKGKLVILQSNDSFIEEGHVNAVTNLDEFSDMFHLDLIYYKGQINLQKYTRYMLIGVK